MLLLVSLKDAKLGVYLPPQPVKHQEEAIRGLRKYVNDPKAKESHLFQYPDDYSLWHVGHFDEDTGAVSPITPKQIIQISQLKEVTA